MITFLKIIIIILFLYVIGGRTPLPKTQKEFFAKLNWSFSGLDVKITNYMKMYITLYNLSTVPLGCFF